MITLTIAEPITLTKTHFRDALELRHFLDAELDLDENFDIDFRRLEDHEVTPELIRKAAEARKIPLSQLIGIPK